MVSMKDLQKENAELTERVDWYVGEVERLNQVITAMMKCEYSTMCNIDLALNQVMFDLERIDAALPPRRIELGEHEWKVAQRDTVRTIVALRAAKRCLGWMEKHSEGALLDEACRYDCNDISPSFVNYEED